MAAAPDILTWLTYAAIVTMIVAYALERWPIEVVSLVALVGWLVLFWAVPKLTGIESPLGPDELLAGLSNEALITVLAVLVVGQGLFHTDALEKPATLLARLGGRTGMGAVVSGAGSRRWSPAPSSTTRRWWSCSCRSSPRSPPGAASPPPRS